MTSEIRSGTFDGPWDQAFWVLFPIGIRSKSNFRRSKGRRSGWDDLASFELMIRTAVTDALPDGWEVGPAHPAPVSARPAVVALIAGRTMLDSSNLSKSALDAVQANAKAFLPPLVYHSDASVRVETSFTERGSKDQWALLVFARLAPDASREDLATASAKLNELWLTVAPAT